MAFAIVALLWLTRQAARRTPILRARSVPHGGLGWAGARDEAGPAEGGGDDHSGGQSLSLQLSVWRVSAVVCGEGASSHSTFTYKGRDLQTKIKYKSQTKNSREKVFLVPT